MTASWEGSRGESLHCAARDGRPEEVEAVLVTQGQSTGLIDAVDPHMGMTALMHAANGKKVAAVEVLLRHGADPRVKNLLGDTALSMLRLDRSSTQDADYNTVASMLRRALDTIRPAPAPAPAPAQTACKRPARCAGAAERDAKRAATEDDMATSPSPPPAAPPPVPPPAPPPAPPAVAPPPPMLGHAAPVPPPVVASAAGVASQQPTAVAKPVPASAPPAMLSATATAEECPATWPAIAPTDTVEALCNALRGASSLSSSLSSALR